MNKLEQSTLAVVFKNGGQNWFIWSLVKITPASARGKWFTVPDHQSVGDTLEPVLAVEMQSTGSKVGTESKKGGKGLWARTLSFSQQDSSRPALPHCAVIDFDWHAAPSFG